MHNLLDLEGRDLWIRSNFKLDGLVNIPFESVIAFFILRGLGQIRIGRRR